MQQLETGIETELLLVIIGMFVVFLALSIAFLATLVRLLERIPEDDRAMRPGSVWLNLIPIFNVGWMIYTTVMVARSIGRAKGSAEAPTMGIGLSYSVTSAVSTFFPPAGIGTLILWIMYWVIIARQSRSLELSQNLPSHHRPNPQVPR